MHKLETKILKNLLEVYGEEDQLLQAMGECGELVGVTQNYLRAQKYGYKKEKFIDVLSEAVDVYFMMQQIREMDPSMFDYLCTQKEIKLFQKISKEPP